MRVKDFYLAQILRNENKSILSLIFRLIRNPESLEKVPSPAFRKFIEWSLDNIVSGNILTVENWVESSFHLCKQRWDQSMDWLERQPMSKIQLMLQVQKNYVEEQEKLLKKK